MVAECGRVWESVAWAGSVARVWHLNTAAGDTKLGSRWRCEGWANCQITHPLYLVFLVPVPIVRPRIEIWDQGEWGCCMCGAARPSIQITGETMEIRGDSANCRWHI